MLFRFLYYLCKRLAGAVGRQSALHKENSRFTTPTLGRHISTFRGYQILFFIRNPYINRFTFPTHFVLFPSALIGPIDGTVCPAEYALYHVCCCLRMQIIWRAALSSSHHAMCCCHHSVSIARSRLMVEK
jgi:hypothetical protein